MASTPIHRIVIPIYPGVELLDVAGPAEVFVQASRATGRTHYEVRYVSAQAGSPVPSSAGLPLGAEPLPTARTRIDTLLLPGADGEPLRRALDDARRHGNSMALLIERLNASGFAAIFVKISCKKSCAVDSSCQSIS